MNLRIGQIVKINRTTRKYQSYPDADDTRVTGYGYYTGIVHDYASQRYLIKWINKDTEPYYPDGIFLFDSEFELVVDEDEQALVVLANL